MGKRGRRTSTEAQRLERFRRRSGTLVTMSRALSEEFGAHVAVVAFSPTGEPLAFGAPSVDSVLRTYLPAAAPPPASTSAGAETAEEAAARVAGMKRGVQETRALVAEEWARVAAASENIKAAQASAQKRNWWEVDVDALGEEDLPVFIRALELLRAEVQGRVDALASARPLPPLKMKKLQ
ncbi:hypothetical protein ACP4OV_013045 [Aristida adscensionis]